MYWLVPVAQGVPSPLTPTSGKQLPVQLNRACGYKWKERAADMAGEGYEKVIEESMKTTEMACGACQGEGKFTTVRLKNIEPEEVLGVFICSQCGEKTVDFFDTKKGKCSKLTVMCNFDDRMDLQREVNLNQYAQIELIHDDFCYAFESAYPIIYTVEALIQQAQDEIKAVVTGEEDKSVTEAAEYNLRKLKEMLETYRFKMVINDKNGLSRVAPVGKSLASLSRKGLDSFNDSKVKHMIEK
jgi:C4-type Zn-finger protein